jgi:hypothetical protein
MTRSRLTSPSFAGTSAAQRLRTSARSSPDAKAAHGSKTPFITLILSRRTRRRTLGSYVLTISACCSSMKWPRAARSFPRIWKSSLGSRWMARQARRKKRSRTADSAAALGTTTWRGWYPDYASTTPFGSMLRGFERVHLEPGEKRRIAFTLAPRAALSLRRRGARRGRPRPFSVESRI